MATYPKNGINAVPTNGPVTIGTSSTLIAPANPKRTRLFIANDGGATVFLGFGAAATTSMFPLKNGGTIEITNSLDVNGIVAASTNVVKVLEEGRA